jgi:hypothetical protein
MNLDPAPETVDEPAEPEESAEPAEPAEPAALPGTKEIDHPDLGAAIAILDNRRRTRRDLWLSLACLFAGFLGVYFGYTDAQNGDGTAWFWMLSGLVLVAYGVGMLRSAVLRFISPIRFVFGAAAFDFAGRPGPEPIRWAEVSAAELEIPAKQSRAEGICFQVRSPEAFAERRGLAPRAARRLIDGGGWISVRGETALPLDEVVDLMRERIEAQKPASIGSPAAARRHRKRTSRH